MKIDKQQNVMTLLESVCKEVRKAVPNVDQGGCGLYASVIGTILNYNIFTPIIANYGRCPYCVKINALVEPPPHVQLLFEYNKQQFLYDSDGFKEITENNNYLIAENSDEFNSRKHTHVKITWKSLLKITQEPYGWNRIFDRDTDTYNLLETVYNTVSNSNITPDLIAVQDFMEEFKGNL